MVGTPSGYLETLPPSVQRRISTLKELNKETEALEKN